MMEEMNAMEQPGDGGPENPPRRLSRAVGIVRWIVRILCMALAALTAFGGMLGAGLSGARWSSAIVGLFTVVEIAVLIYAAKRTERAVTVGPILAVGAIAILLWALTFSLCGVTMRSVTQNLLSERAAVPNTMISPDSFTERPTA